MKAYRPLITIIQYSMSTARGAILQSTSFDSFEKALRPPPLCAGTESIVIKNNEAGTVSVFTPDSCDFHSQFARELNGVFADESH